MTTVAVIPARFGSTRFPGKPLADKTGKYLIQHVYERVAACSRIDRAIVATDDARIAQAVTSFGGEAELTRADHPSGTDRVAEVAGRLNLADDTVVLNVQGDEPEIAHAALEQLIGLMGSRPGSFSIGTLAAPFADDGPRTGPGSPLDPHCVKVVVDENGRAMYFSRSAIPYPRSSGGSIDRPSRWLLHLGVYAFRAATLRDLTTMRSTAGRLEQMESLEQLRWLEQGHAIGVAIVADAFVGIDTPEDYEAFVRRSLAAVTG